jgi:hypothetical protein
MDKPSTMRSKEESKERPRTSVVLKKKPVASSSGVGGKSKSTGALRKGEGKAPGTVGQRPKGAGGGAKRRVSWTQ